MGAVVRSVAPDHPSYAEGPRLWRRNACRAVTGDGLYHRAGWQEAPVDELRAEVRRAIASHQESCGGWVVDGNYESRLADVLADADSYVWLDYPRRVVMPPVLRRTLGSLVPRRELWNGNRESWRFLLSRHNIVMWCWTHHSA